MDKSSQNLSIWADLGSSGQKIIDKYSQNLSIWADFGQIGQIFYQILARLARFLDKFWSGWSDFGPIA